MNATRRKYLLIGSSVALVLIVAVRVFLSMNSSFPSMSSQFADGMTCPSSHAVTTVSDIHYPDAKDCAEIEEDVEWSLESFHYKKACEKKTGNKSVAAARMASCGLASSVWKDEKLRGVVVAVDLCCGEPLD